MRWWLGDRPSCYFGELGLSTFHLTPCPQMKLKPIAPRTEEEKTEHSVAAERRRLRLVYADTIKDLLANCVIQDGEWPWVRRTAGILLAPLCPGPALGRGKKGVSLGLGSTHWWPQAWLALLPQGLLQGKESVGASCPASRSREGGVRTYGKSVVVHQMHLSL